MARRTFVYEEVSLRQGWYSSQPDPVDEDLPNFLQEVLGDGVDIWDENDNWGDFYEEIRNVQGPKGGRARATIYFKGVPFSIYRRQIRTIHCSEKERWEVKITVRQHPPKDGERIVYLPHKKISFSELWRAAVFSETQHEAL